MGRQEGVQLSKQRRRVMRKRRTDAGSLRYMTRDSDVMRLGAEQTFVRYDTAAEYLAPGYTPACAVPPSSQLADLTPSAKRGWPADLRHRLMAMSRLMRKLEARGCIEIIQPWADQPAWFRVTGQGLRLLGLDWPEIPFPATYEDLEARLRHDHSVTSHNHLVNQVRLLLARGAAGAPTHTWKGERAIEVALPPREKGVRRPHKPDGILGLVEGGTWAIKAANGTILDTVTMHPGEIVAIEVESTQKSSQRLAEILPDLLAHHEYVWYFCRTSTIRHAVADARRDALTTHAERRRVRLLLLEDYLSCP